VIHALPDCSPVEGCKLFLFKDLAFLTLGGEIGILTDPDQGEAPLKSHETTCAGPEGGDRLLSYMDVLLTNMRKYFSDGL